MDKHGKEWSARVDTAIVSFVDNIRSALKKPCILRSIKKKKKVTIEVIGWTDPRQIDMACLYTGKDIDFNKSAIKMYEIEKKPYVHNGILKHNTKFRESANGGNQLLSEVRAYYTAELLDNLWKLALPDYARLRAEGIIDIVAVGKSIKPDQIDMARQRSVNVRILADVEAEVATTKNRPELGSSIALCGNDCLINLVCREIERTAKISIEESLGSIGTNPEPKESEPVNIDEAIKDKKVSSKEAVKPIKEAAKDNAVETPKVETEKPVVEPKLVKAESPKIVVKEDSPIVNEKVKIEATTPKSAACYSIMYCSFEDENATRDVYAKLEGQGVKDLKFTIKQSAEGKVFYRVIAGCFPTINDASSVLREAKTTAKAIGLAKTPVVIKE